MRNFYSNNKYRNHKVFIGGQKYDSKKEAYRHQELKLLERAGEISCLETQVKYTLQCGYNIIKNGKKSKVAKLESIPDFKYVEKGNVIIEDLKSEATEKDNVYRIKRKLLLCGNHDFDIFREVIHDKYGRVTVNNYEKYK